MILKWDDIIAKFNISSVYMVVSKDTSLDDMIGKVWIFEEIITIKSFTFPAENSSSFWVMKRMRIKFETCIEFRNSGEEFSCLILFSLLFESESVYRIDELY